MDTPIPITTAVAGGWAAYSVAVILYKRLKRFLGNSTRITNKSTIDPPVLPKEIWSQILSEFVIDYPREKDLLNLALVNKSTHEFIRDLFSRRNGFNQFRFPFTATPILCHFIRRKNRQASHNVFNGNTNPLYGPWMDNNMLRSPETFWKFLIFSLTKPTWLRFYEAEARPAAPSMLNGARHFNRLRPVVSILRILSLTPVLDLILQKFQTGVYSWANVWSANILYWRSPFKLLVPVIMLMANQAFELDLNNYRGLWIRTAIYLLISALQYGGTSIIIPTLVLSLVLIGTKFDKNFASRQGIWFTCYFSIIAMIILFPSTLVLLPYPIYYIASAFLFPKEFSMPINVYGGCAATLITLFLTAKKYL